MYATYPRALLGMSDISQLSAEFTFISRDVLRTSWIDHIACSTYVTLKYCTNLLVLCQLR